MSTSNCFLSNSFFFIMKYTFLAISLKLIAVKMILNQQRRVSDENSENPALLSENHRLNTSIVAIPLFSSVSYEQRLLVILSSCNWMHRKHTRKHATGQYEQCESTFRRDALFATVICPEIFDRTILFFSPISTEKVVNFSKKKKTPPLVSFMCRKAFISWCIEK